MKTPYAYTSLTTSRYALLVAGLVAASVAFSLFFACAAPLAGFALFAALTLPLRRAIFAVLAVWFANQVLGYGFLDYPVDVSSMGWGLILGVSAVTATFAAHFVAARDGSSPALTISVSFIAAFAAYQGVMFLAALSPLGGMESNTAEVVFRSFIINAAAFVGLFGAQRLSVLAPKSKTA